MSCAMVTRASCCRSIRAERPFSAGRPIRISRAAPGPVDVALVAVPAAQLRQTIEECGAAGVGACVVITAQLGEFDEAGERLQDEIVQVAAKATACGWSVRIASA